MPHALSPHDNVLPAPRSNALLTGVCALLTLLLPAATLVVITCSSGLSRAFAEPASASTTNAPVSAPAQPLPATCPSTDALSGQCTGTPTE